MPSNPPVHPLRFTQPFQAWLALLGHNPAEAWRQLLYVAFWICMAFFASGYGWREALPPLCLVFLLLYYKYDWRNSVLRNLKVGWLFVCGAAMVLLGIICSRDPFSSLIHSGANLNKAFILPFIAMECVRSAKELRWLVWAYAFACFWQGLDGIWQAVHGLDFVMGYPLNAGRLTGSLGDYSVGNYIALTLVPAFGVWVILRRKLRLWACVAVFLAILGPAFFLLQGASSRSGTLAVAGACGLWFALRYGWRGLPRMFAAGVLVLALFMLLQPGRLLPQQIMQDNRWDLWRLGWQVFLEYPLLGVGAGQYNPGFQELGLAPVREVITISHPHNLYLDLLYAHGVIGFSLGMLFLCGFLFWGYRKVTTRLRAQAATDYWKLTAWFWIGYAAWFINGIFGHDFYRTWWLGQTMATLGIMIGAIETGYGMGPGSRGTGKLEGKQAESQKGQASIATATFQHCRDCLE